MGKATEIGDIIYYRPWMYKKQEEAIFNDSRYAVCEASTKSGKTYGCLVWLFEKALSGRKGYNYWWVAPVSHQADIAWRRMKDMVPDNLYDKNEQVKRMDLVNGTHIHFKTGDSPDSLYGEDVYAAVVDEASRVKEESWHAVRSTLTSTRAPVRIIGNVKGRKNWAYKMARVAEQKQDERPDKYNYTKITAYDAAEAGVIDWEEIEDAKSVYPRDKFRELYLAEPAKDGGNPFGITHIHSCVARGEDGRPKRELFEGPPVAWGWDLGKHTNWTVGIALNTDGEVCEFHRWKEDWELTFRRIIRLTRGTRAYVDATRGSGGDPMIDRLQREGGHNFRGFKFSSMSKQALMEGLATAIQHNEIKYPDGRIVEELEAFEYEKTRTTRKYSAPEGMHDDCVDALAMAVEIWQSNNQSGNEAEPMSFHKVSHWK